MTSLNLPFSSAEYAGRLARTRRAMEQKGLDIILISDPSNMAWLTGYDGWSFYVHQCVLISGDGDPVWFGRKQDANGAKRTTYLDDDLIVSYPDHYVQSPDRHPFDFLSDWITRQGWSDKHFGVEMDNYWFSAAAFASLQHHLPNARFSDATALVNWQRAVKSDQELAYMRKAARLVERAHQVIFEKSEPGYRKCDLVADIYDALLRYDDGLGHGGDYPAIVPLIASGTDAAAPHLTWNDDPLRYGEGTFFEIAGVYKHYHCPLSRTLFLGKPPSTFIEAEKAVLEGMEAGLEQAKAGNLCEDIARAFFSVLKKYGFEKDNRTGYPIGLSYPPDWGERTMSLRIGDKSELQPNMTFHFMTALWQDDWGFEITESILIGDKGASCLARVARQLMVKD